MTIVSVFNDTKGDLKLHSRSYQGSEGNKVLRLQTSDFFIPDGEDIFIKIWPTALMVMQSPVVQCSQCGCREAH